MNPAVKKNIIEFYDKQVWRPDLPKSDALTDEDLKYFKNTLAFATWNLLTNITTLEIQILKMFKKLLTK